MTNVFGFNRQPDLNSPITADSFYSVTSVISNDDYRDIREKVYSRLQWTDLKLENHEKMVSEQTPPFVMIEISNGLETKTIIHLQEGVRKETYGNVLDRYEEVKNYCDSFYFKDQEWKLGSPSVCYWRPEQVLSTLPVIHTCNGKEFIPGPEMDICYHDDDESSYGLVFNIYNWKDCSDLCVGDATCHRWTYLEEFTKCKKFKAEDVKKYPGVGCTSGGVCIRSGPKPNEPVPVPDTPCPWTGYCYNKDESQGKKTNLNSWQDCLQSCQLEWNCESWTYVRQTRSCFFFNSKSPPLYKGLGCVSGHFECRVN